MLDEQGRPVTSSSNSFGSPVVTIDQRADMPGFEPMINVLCPTDVEERGLLHDRIQCTALSCDISANFRQRIPGSEAVSEPLFVGSTKLAVWPVVNRISPRELHWSWYGTIFCWKSLSFEGPLNWDDGTKDIVNKKTMPLIREWLSVCRLFENASPFAEYSALVSNWFDENNRSSNDEKPGPIWQRVPRAYQNRVTFESDIKL